LSARAIYESSDRPVLAQGDGSAVSLACSDEGINVSLQLLDGD